MRSKEREQLEDMQATVAEGMPWEGRCEINTQADAYALCMTALMSQMV
jgi:hypothetical protein